MDLPTRDLLAVWHPFSKQKGGREPLPIVRGEGALLFGEKGESYIDAISSWWVNLHGHSHPHIIARMHEQLQTLDHVIFADFTHEPAVRLAEELLQILPKNQARIFYSDDGSTAVEVGIKMALQYWHNLGTKKDVILALKNSYHGDTFGAMSVSGRGSFTAPFATHLFEVIHLTDPYPGQEDKFLEELNVALNQKNIAAFIFEPLVQGVAGMQMYEATLLDKTIELCRAHNVLAIADEVMTGFGRTGKFFASDYLTQSPDIICLAKGITGGVLPLGATACSKQVFEAFNSEERSKTFFHGHSFTANPLGCAAALASLELLKAPECQQKIDAIASQHKEFLKKLDAHPLVKNVRTLGTILAYEVESSGTPSYFHPLRDKLYNHFLQNGVLLRPLGNTVYILPPYCITIEQLSKVYSVILSALDQVRPEILNNMERAA